LVKPRKLPVGFAHGVRPGARTGLRPCTMPGVKPRVRAVAPALALAVLALATPALAASPALAVPPVPPVAPVAPVETTPDIRIAASIFPIAAIAREIGGARVAVKTIVPSGSDPHNFEVTPAMARAVDDADLVFFIGGHFDGWAMGHRQRLKPSSYIEFQDVLKDSLIKTAQEVNPHLWLDPLLAKSMGQAIKARLAQTDPANRAYYEERARSFAVRIDSLDAAARSRLAECGFRDFVSFHPAWTYLARRYGLEEHGSIELTPEQEPSAKWIAGILKMMQREGVKYIVAEEFSNRALAESLARDAQAQVIVLDPLGAEDRPGRSSYFELVNYNLDRIEEAASRTSAASHPSRGAPAPGPKGTKQ
jgi:zinc transport system substrate-binding protein